MNIAVAIPLADSWGMHGSDVGVGWMVVMMVGMVVFWAAVILGIVWLVRGTSGGWRSDRKETPLEILDRRFAEGAMSADEYHERRQVITTGAHSR